MKDAEEKRWHLDRFQKAALYWNNLANQQIFELNKQLLAFATIILPLTASITVIDSIKLREYQIMLLILGWISLFLSIISGFIQIWIDAKYFNYVSNDSSTREFLWSQDEDNNKIKDAVDKLGHIKPSSSPTPTYFQIFFVLTGLLMIMTVAVSMLISKNEVSNFKHFLHLNSHSYCGRLK